MNIIGNKKTKNIILTIIMCLCLQLMLCANLFQSTKISEVGYFRRLWDSDTLEVQIKCYDGKIIGSIKKTKNQKFENKIFVKVKESKFRKFEDYVIKKDIMYLKSIRLIDPSMGEKVYNESYYKIPRMYSFIYEIYFVYHNIKYSYFVDDVGYAKDKRYLEVIKRINGLLNIKTEVNVFGDDSTQ